MSNTSIELYTDRLQQRCNEEAFSDSEAAYMHQNKGNY